MDSSTVCRKTLHLVVDKFCQAVDGRLNDDDRVVLVQSACEKNTNFKKSKVLQIAEVQAHLFVAKNYFFFVSIYAESRLPQDRIARSGLLFGVRVFTYSK
jgi:hypothetical protein